MDDRPWFKSYDPGLPRTLQPYLECTLPDLVAETPRNQPEHTALLFKGARMSYGELERLSDAFAAALVHLEVQKGDHDT